MLAVGLNLITGFRDQVSLGHAAFFGARAYAAALCAVAGWSLPLALLAGCVVASAFGLVVGGASIRLAEDCLAVTTIGFARKAPWLGAEMGIGRIPATGLGATGDVAMIMGFAAAAIAFSLVVRRSWMGFAFQAVADDERAARTLAIPTGAYKLSAFAMGTTIAGLAGGLYTYFTRFIVPDSFGFILSVTIMAMVVIGGVGSSWGAILLTPIPEAFRFVDNYKLLIFGGTLVLVMRFAPSGLAGLAGALIARARACATVSPSRGSRSALAASRRSTPSRSRSAKANSRASSAPTARARHRCCDASPACCAPTPDGSRSAGMT
jgi:branched-chain amino acid transport system permease protein